MILSVNIKEWNRGCKDREGVNRIGRGARHLQVKLEKSKRKSLPRKNTPHQPASTEGTGTSSDASGPGIPGPVQSSRPTAAAYGVVDVREPLQKARPLPDDAVNYYLRRRRIRK